MTTVRVDRLENLPAVQMIWEHTVTPDDVSTAFRQVNQLLTASEIPLFVIVDIRNNPNFPVSTTVNSAIFGPYRNPSLEEWLMLGTSPLARTIERILASVTGRGNVRWFSTEDEVSEYLLRQRNMSAS
jgi:hypothetical protein